MTVSSVRNRGVREIWGFLVVLFATSAVFYLVGPLIGSLSVVTQANVPAAALGVVCPAIAAVVMAGRTGSVRQLRTSVTARPVGVAYGVIAVIGLPLVVLVSALLTGQRINFESPGVGVLGLAGVYVVGSLAEEIGWTAFLLPRLLQVTGETRSALMIGGVWALWHVIPYVQAGQPPAWVLGQCVFTVVLRVLLVRLTVGSEGSVWLAVLCHAAYNLAWSLSPNAGAGYDPWVAAAITGAVAAILSTVRLRWPDRSLPF